MIKFFLVKKKRLVKGEITNPSSDLVDAAFEYVDGIWVKIDRNEINDRLLGFDPTEEGIYALGNTEILESIEEIPKSEIAKYM